MGAHVDHEFDKCFELDETRIRKIYSIFKERVPKAEVDNIYFSIQRGDSSSYQTNNIEDLLSEDNDSTNNLIKVDYIFLSETLSVRVSFSKKDGCALDATGEIRDDVFLITSDLKDYIGKEVCCQRNFQKLNFSKIILLIPIAAIGAMLFKLYTHQIDPTNPEFIAILKNENANDKLNFLIQQNMNNASRGLELFPAFALIFVMIVTIFLPTAKIFNFFFPKNIFFIGKEILIVNKKRKLNSNIFWGVIIATVVSSLVGFLFWKLG